MWHHYFENCNGVVFVIDCNDGARLGMVKDEIWKLLKHPMLETYLFFFANKQDLPNAIRKDALITRLDLLKIRGREWSVAESTATEGHGIEDGFDWLSKHL